MAWLIRSKQQEWWFRGVLSSSQWSFPFQQACNPSKLRTAQAKHWC